MNQDTLIRNNDFCEIVSDKFAETEDVKRGHLVFVAGHQALPIDPEDYYMQRIHFLVHLVDRQGHILPNEGIYLMDPKTIQKVSARRQKRLTNIMKMDFAEPENASVN